MKKRFLFLITMMFVLGWAFCAYGAGDAVKLKFATYMPPKASPVGIFKEWGEKVEEQTNGKVKVTVFAGGSLVKAPETLRAVQKGVADLAFQVVNREQKFALASVISLPMMGWPSVRAANRIWDDLYAKFPELRKEYDGLKYMWHWTSNAMILNTTKKEARVPADLKGQKIIVALPVAAKAMKGLGASPIVQPPPEWYMSLERGLAEGILAGYGTAYAQRIYKLTPYHYEAIFSQPGLHVIMNIDKWKSLSPDVQKVMDGLSSWASKALVEANYKEVEEGKEACKKLGHTFITPKPAEINKWQAVVKPIHESWVKGMESKGLPARAIYDETLRLIKKYSK